VVNLKTQQAIVISSRFEVTIAMEKVPERKIQKASGIIRHLSVIHHYNSTFTDAL
jgi:hypothetical protein